MKDVFLMHIVATTAVNPWSKVAPLEGYAGNQGLSSSNDRMAYVDEKGRGRDGDFDFYFSSRAVLGGFRVITLTFRVITLTLWTRSLGAWKSPQMDKDEKRFF